jgi:hypothetical protein
MIKGLAHRGRTVPQSTALRSRDYFVSEVGEQAINSKGTIEDQGRRSRLFWRAAVDHRSALAMQCSLRPSARKIDQSLFLFFGIGSARQIHRHFRISPKLIDFNIDPPF